VKITVKIYGGPCNELNVKPGTDLSTITREQASRHITILKNLRLAKRRNY
jgi:hypothetical protein